MSDRKTTIILAAFTVVFPVVIYCLQLWIFEDPRTTFFYLLQDLAFVPISVALVTLVFNKLLSNRENAQKIKRNNVMITTFFVESGTDMIVEMAKFNKNFEEFRKILASNNLTGTEIIETKANASNYNFIVDSRTGDLEEFAKFFTSKRNFMLSMLDNRTLLEHDTFTDMLWAIFHLADELQSRANLKELPAPDMDHLSIDILRAYKLIILEWIDYIKYLGGDYPYLFSLAVRKNPFSDNIDVRILK
ncbi:MAG: hypothetical protein WCF96_05310 [Eubacteriales bacterium]